MTLYERIIKRETTDENLNEKIQKAYLEIYKKTLNINEATKITVDEFISNLESAVKKIFPKSYINIYASTNLGEFYKCNICSW